MAVVGNTAKDIININYKVIIEALIEVYFKVIIKRNIIFIRSQIISFAKVYKILKIKKSLQPIFKAF